MGGLQTGGRGTLVPYGELIEQFRAAPPGKLYMVHGTPAVFRLSLTAAAHVLLNGIPMTLVDGTNRFDVYYIAEFARRFAERKIRGRYATAEALLDSIFISRAFTCYQMEALVTNRLPAFVRKSGSPIVLIFGLVDTFYDEQAPLFEVRESLRRIIASLRCLRSDGISVLVASADLAPATVARNSLLPMVAGAMDRLYRVREEEMRLRIEAVSPNVLRS